MKNRLEMVDVFLGIKTDERNCVQHDGKDKLDIGDVDTEGIVCVAACEPSALASVSVTDSYPLSSCRRSPLIGLTQLATGRMIHFQHTGRTSLSGRENAAFKDFTKPYASSGL